MRRQENAIDTAKRLLFRGAGIVFLIGLATALLLFLQAGCGMSPGQREREERAQREAQQRYERERSEAQRKGNDPNSAVRKLNSGKWLPEERKTPK